MLQNRIGFGVGKGSIFWIRYQSNATMPPYFRQIIQIDASRNQLKPFRKLNRGRSDYLKMIYQTSVFCIQYFVFCFLRVFA